MAESLEYDLRWLAQAWYFAGSAGTVSEDLTSSRGQARQEFSLRAQFLVSASQNILPFLPFHTTSWVQD